MEPHRQSQLTFHITGRRNGAGLEGIDDLGMRPALLARYRDLPALRYAYPLVLVSGDRPEGAVRGLSELFDAALRHGAPGGEADRLAKHARRIEREVRVGVADGERGTLHELFDKSVAGLSLSGDALLGDSAERLRAALPADAEPVDCDRALPVKLLEHLWRATHALKARRFRDDVDRLIVQLSDILRADFVKSEEGRSPTSLKASVGSTFEATFDFEALSNTLSRGGPEEALPDGRRERIERLLKALRSQRFCPASGAAAKPYNFVFESAVAALAAYRERLPEAVELARAMAAAELEVKGEYRGAWHDQLFQDYGVNGLDPADLVAFPDYLVSVDAGKMKASDSARLIEMLATGLPMKILLQTDDLLGDQLAGDGHLAFGLHNRFLASTAMSLNDVFVLQASASCLPAVCASVVRGLRRSGPALFSVFSGAGSSTGDLPAYLVAAAAVEARVFPTFMYDPDKGGDWATRFDLGDNPQPDADWPVQTLSYEDQAMQRHSEEVAFTFLDFAACDRRFATHFALVDRTRWNGTMIAAPEALNREPKGLPEQVPYVMMVDAENRLHKVLADQRLAREARRCRDMWRSLQELGGIHNSHARRLLETEREAWVASLQQEVQAAAPGPTVASASTAEATATVAPAETPAAALEAVETPPSDDPYIETARCTTCNECTQINSRMFAYNENQQAYIADPDAGTFRQLVEAAEGCQVAIIHPGKPRNPNEPGLEELLARAESFA